MSTPSRGPGGSSPLARGLPPDENPHHQAGGIIPARAGFTRVSFCVSRLCVDHPRSRGVYPTFTGARTGADGSSPLARGLQGGNSAGLMQYRIIPARAGFTRRSGRAPSTTGDHPRSRGVYRVWVGARVGGAGSSPLARGLLLDPPAPQNRSGIIPARAGFTEPEEERKHENTDHPRSRGVYVGAQMTFSPASGSSPLARGLRGNEKREENHAGIIPARAGFTLANPWNPNEPVLYQTPVAFTADLGPAPPSCGSAAVVLRWTTTPSGA